SEVIGDSFRHGRSAVAGGVVGTCIACEGRGGLRGPGGGRPGTVRRRGVERDGERSQRDPVACELVPAGTGERVLPSRRAGRAGYSEPPRGTPKPRAPSAWPIA